MNETNSGLPDVPSPPQPDSTIAFFRWLAEFRRATKHRAAASRRTHAARPAGTQTLGTVVIAISSDLAMLSAKAVAASLTGSVALFAEALHSLADTGNQFLLLKGLRRARMRPDLRHPFGYGSEVFFWSLLAALGIFLVGGVLSIWEGVHRLLGPAELQVSNLGLAVLVAGCLLDGTSWMASVRQIRREAIERGISFKEYLRTTTDTAVTAIYHEDAGALLGNMIALTGLAIHSLIHSPVPDAIAGILIGLLLSIVGLRLARRNRDLLTNRSESPLVLDQIRDLLIAGPGIAAVGKVASIYVGPHRLLVVAEVQPEDAMTGLRLRRLLSELRARVVEAVPPADNVFLMPVVAAEAHPELTPWDKDYWLRRFPDHQQE